MTTSAKVLTCCGTQADIKTRLSKISLFINNKDITENLELETDEGSNLSEVILKVKTRDRAEEIIRNVVKNKEAILDAIGSYSCYAYIKATQLDSGFTKKKNENDTAVKTGFDGMSLSEVSLRLDSSSYPLVFLPLACGHKRRALSAWLTTSPPTA